MSQEVQDAAIIPEDLVDTEVEQIHGGVTITYREDHSTAIPLKDYVALLNDVSTTPTLTASQFTSRVGIARVAVLAGLLGLIMGLHLVILVVTWDFPSPATVWCLYTIALCLYHWSEFITTAIFHPHTVNFDSFLVNQSKEYGIAIVLGWIEFAVDVMLFPDTKRNVYVAVIGLTMVVIGQTFRTLAMYQGGPSFTHLVTHSKSQRHTLVTHGVYAYLRHPGYFGWFYWSIGTQVLLGNFFCSIAYFFVAQRFFKDRIPDEEEGLLHIFGMEYAQYRMNTIIGIPGL